MRTPVVDFIHQYNNAGMVRLHMPGHKGVPLLGPEPMDLTEVAGADALYEADGILRESEQNATFLFGTRRTVFSTEGSSQCIRAMLFLAAGVSENPEKPLFVAARNAHKAFLYAAALLDAEVVWLQDRERTDLCSVRMTPGILEETLNALDRKPAGVYLTSPDYLGHEADLAALAEVCHRQGTLLLVDNAHGSYLHFLPVSRHPVDLGADLVCDSAHKTLPALTGAAYLHLSRTAPEGIENDMKRAMALFGSTSPSYLTLASLDLCNRMLAEDYREQLAKTVEEINGIREELRGNGWSVADSDPLKLTLEAPEGRTGAELAQVLRGAGFEPEFADPDHLVLMVTPQIPAQRLREMIAILGRNTAPEKERPFWMVAVPEQKMSIRAAVFSSQEEIPVEEAAGRISASPAVSCPPAVPVVCSGELITAEAVEVMRYYGIRTIAVVRKKERDSGTKTGPVSSVSLKGGK